MSRLAAGLEGRGLLVRERDPANRRYYRLRLTDTGRTLAEQIGAELHEHHRVLLSAMSPEERAGLALGLTGLLRAMEETDHMHGAAVQAPGRRPGQ